MPKQTENNQITELMTYLPVIVTVIIIVTLSSTLLKSKIQDILVVKDQISQSQEVLDKITKKIEILQKVDYVSLTEKNTKLKQTLPSSKNIPQVLSTLEIITNNSGMELVLLKVNPGEISTPSASTNNNTMPQFKDSYDIELSLLGSYEKLITLVKDLDRTNPVFLIENISISNAAKKETDFSNDQISALVKINAFYYPELVTIGKVSDSLPILDKNKEELLSQFQSFQTYSQTIEKVPTGKKNPFVLAD